MNEITTTTREEVSDRIHIQWCASKDACDVCYLLQYKNTVSTLEVGTVLGSTNQQC